MRILDIAYYNILQNFRDKKETLIQIFGPIVLVFILGNALGGSFETSPMEIDIALVLEYESLESVGLKEYLEVVENEGHINFEVLTDLDELKEKVKNGLFDSGIVVTENNVIEILKNSERGLQNDIIKQIIKGYENYISMEAIKTSSGFEGIESVNAVNRIQVSFEGRTPRAVDYYAVTMLAMYMFFGAGYGAVSMGTDYFDVRGQRVKSSTIKFSEHFIGLALGNILTLVLQGLSVVIFTTFAFGSNFGNNPLFIVFAITTFAILSTALGMFITVLMKDGNKGVTVVNTLIPVLTLASGGFMKIGGQGILSKIQNFAPNYHFQEILFNNAFNSSPELIRASMMILWAMIVVSFLGTIALKGRKI